MRSHFQFRHFIIFLLFLSFRAQGQETEVVLQVRPIDGSQPAESSISALVDELNSRLEAAPEIESEKNVLSRTLEYIRARYNYKNRVRISAREINRVGVQNGAVPAHAVLMNTAALALTAHVGESVFFGPLFIKLGESGVLPPIVGHPLALWGAALINPVPTGLIFIDAATESFCYVAIFLSKNGSLQRAMYRLETMVVQAVGFSKYLGTEVIWSSLMRSQAGLEMVQAALEARENAMIEISENETEVTISDDNGYILAQLRFEKLDNGDARLASFTLTASAGNPAGRKVLARRLKVFGGGVSGVRDAVLNPEALVRGKHGEKSVRPGGPDLFIVEGTSVLLKRGWSLKPAVRKALAEKMAWLKQSTSDAFRNICGAIVNIAAQNPYTPFRF